MARTGVVGVIRGKKGWRHPATIGLRADMTRCRSREATGLSYKSQEPQA